MNTYESRSNGRGIGDQLRHSRQEAREVGSEVADIAADLRHYGRTVGSPLASSTVTGVCATLVSDAV